MYQTYCFGHMMDHPSILKGMIHMPAVVGPVQVGRMLIGGVVTIGDHAFITPDSSTKTTMGSGALSTANYAFVDNQFDINTNFEGSLSDEPIVNNF